MWQLNGLAQAVFSRTIYRIITELTKENKNKLFNYLVFGYFESQYHIRMYGLNAADKGGEEKRDEGDKLELIIYLNNITFSGC